MGHDHNPVQLTRFSSDRTQIAKKVRPTKNNVKMTLPPTENECTGKDSMKPRDKRQLKVPTQRMSSISLGKLEKLKFHLPSLEPDLSADIIKATLWPPFQRESAVDMDVTKRTSDIKITIYFRNVQDGMNAHTHISKNSLKRLLAELDQPCNLSAPTKPAVRDRFLGPNGQRQWNLPYKHGQCSLGCLEFVAKEDTAIHLLTCTAQKHYLEFRRQYESNELRLNERPKPLIPRGEKDSEDDEEINKNGYFYGYGPYIMKKELLGKKPPTS